MPRDDAILWIDLETTGSSNEAKILEFGGILTTATPDLEELGRFQTLVDPYPVDTYEADVVVEMHKKSGLTDDLKMNSIVLPSVVEAEQAILRWINDTIGFSTEHLPWGGSGVGHFDAKYIRRDWLYLAKRLTYWVYDVGVMRRMMRLGGFELPVDDTGAKNHRALDDAEKHAQEARLYLQQIQTWKGTNSTNAETNETT
jgi:oligoribonuclease (3'-5' exoribonuclease)